MKLRDCSLRASDSSLDFSPLQSLLTSNLIQSVEFGVLMQFFDILKALSLIVWHGPSRSTVRCLGILWAGPIGFLIIKKMDEIETAL